MNPVDTRRTVATNAVNRTFGESENERDIPDRS
jgi:hypothetical protein